MKKIIVIILVAFILIQFFPIDKTNPPPTPGMDFLKIKNTPDKIARTLRTSCYDCHSNETTYPWYANISPASWWVKITSMKEGNILIFLPLQYMNLKDSFINWKNV
nr:heme-binding domain-containing protein [Chryseobacterium sp. MEBOG07]